MAKACRLIDKSFSSEDMKAILLNIRKLDLFCMLNDNDVPDAPKRRTTLDLMYQEWLEGLVALAVYSNPNPYTPLLETFLGFLMRDFFPVLERLKLLPNGIAPLDSP